MTYSRILTAVAGVLAACAALVGPAPAAAAGAGIYIAGEATGNLTVYNDAGVLIDGGPTSYNVSDAFAVGDVDGDGEDEFVVAGDYTHVIDIYEPGVDGTIKTSFFGDFTPLDSLAVGDVLGDERAEILVAGDYTNEALVYDENGTLLATIFVNYTELDGFATGDLDGDGKDEILVAGDFSNDMEVFDGAGTLLRTFDCGYTVSDQIATGDIDGDGNDEIMISGDFSNDVDVFDGDGTLVRTFFADYTISDGFAAGDVDGDGDAEVLVAGDVSSDVQIYNPASGGLVKTLDLDFTIGDGFAVGRFAFPDRDADGLLDSWETGGFDSDGDGDIDVNLPAFGADPDHKDLFLELDWTAGDVPNQRAIRSLKDAFARAPLSVGGVANPDGVPGINLHVDTGAATDAAGIEGATPAPGSCTDGLDNDNDGGTDRFDGACAETSTPIPGECADGIDNDNDGFTDANDSTCNESRFSCSDTRDNDADGMSDAADPDCLIGDNLGQGNLIAATVDCLDTLFYVAKGNNFPSSRRRIFRYAVSSTVANCGGGKGEIGGNDFLELNHDAGTIMHELGHTLNLHHGGDDDINCKPGFVSVMNYDHQFGIPQADGSTVLDYSPSRRLDGSRGPAMSFYKEDDLDESDVWDATDTSTLLTYTDANNVKRNTPVSQPIDWDGDGVSGSSTDLTVNIDDDGTLASPAACDNSADSDILYGHHDWSVVSLNFRGFGDYDDSAKNPTTEREQTLEEMLRHQRVLNTTDLRSDVADSVDPGIAGTAVQYEIRVRNHGLNPTRTSQLRATLPAGTTHVSTPGCFFGEDTVTCDTGMLMPGDERTFTTTVMVDADLVHLAGAPVTLETEVVSMNFAGDDVAPVNDVTVEATQVVAVADLDLLGVALTAPPDVLIGDPASISASETLTSHGPSSPMDVRVTRAAAADPGVSLAVGEASELAPAVVVGETRTVSSDVVLACSQPGTHSFGLSSSIAPDRPDDSDPVAANDGASADLAVSCVVPVKIRIVPAVRMGRPGMIPVEILSNEAGEHGLPLAFDASSVVAASVRFGSRELTWSETGGSSERHGRAHGGRDRNLHFPLAGSGLDGADDEACVKGTFRQDGEVYEFFGCDALRPARRH